MTQPFQKRWVVLVADCCLLAGRYWGLAACRAQDLLGAPGGSGGSLLGQADSFALTVRSLLLPGVQDPSNQCLLQDAPHTDGICLPQQQ
jgi:hypothetical protein